MNAESTIQKEFNPFISGTLEELLKTIASDGVISIEEYQQVREEADKRMENLIGLFGTRNSTLKAYMNSMDVTMQLLQLTALQAKNAKLTDTGEAIVRDALMAQVEYLRAGANLVLRLLLQHPRSRRTNAR